MQLVTFSPQANLRGGFSSEGALQGNPGLPPTDNELPKIALMFLTRGPMPLEDIWKWFLGSETSSAWTSYFSLYVHPAPDYTPEPTSFFAQFALPVKERVKIEWGQHSMVEAERSLLRAALKDPLNQFFVFVADDAIPLYRPSTMYLQLMSETRSRINSCKNMSDPADIERVMIYRWQREMAAGNLTVDLWRKDSQWTSLIRKHAKLSAEETVLNDIFTKECWSEGLSNPEVIRRFCVSDEHYIPSLLAVYGLEDECYCDGVMTHVYWQGNYYHPYTYSAAEVYRALCTCDNTENVVRIHSKN